VHIKSLHSIVILHDFTPERILYAQNRRKICTSVIIGALFACQFMTSRVELPDSTKFLFALIYLMTVCVIRRQSGRSDRPTDVNAAAGSATSVANEPSLANAMDVDAMSMPAAATHGVDDTRSSASHDTSSSGASQQSKRQVAADSNATECDDERSSKRRRQNSTNTDSSSTSLTATATVPADRSPINASYSSVQRYRTRVSDAVFFCYFIAKCQSG